MSISVLIADDHKMMRDGLRSILDRDPQVDVVGEADDGRSAIRLSRKLAPSVVVMDIGMPNLNGIEATRQITAESPDVRVVALSMFSDKRYVLRMLKAGASAYVMKDAACDELIRAIRAVTQGRRYLSPEITGLVVDSVTWDLPPLESPSDGLGRREREVLQLLAEGNTSSQIAALLHISPKTVDAHRRNLMKKLDLHSIAELTKFAIREGLTTLGE